MVMIETPLKTAGLKCAMIDGYRVQWKDDGTDYPAIWCDFKDGKLDSIVQLHTNCPDRSVFRMETEKGPLVLKHDWERDSRLEKRILRFLTGPWYSRLIRLTNRAVNRGCDIVQDVYLVAEKMEGRFCVDSWLIAEFVEGTVAPASPKYSSLSHELAAVVGRLHDCGLASNDAHGGNFVITDNGEVKIIDLSLTSPLIICQANDILKIKRAYNIDVPVHGFWRRLAAALVTLKYRIQKIRRQRRTNS
ncbi:lipopolysaccharide core biosynthesis protein [Deltaproteobacteria bacterium Smac51]|nr:lipopolysaccharide core biosynthesis protein [Deltaproteobacteria bacterium Smac51]